jgi:hypothetical protein
MRMLNTLSGQRYFEGLVADPKVNVGVRNVTLSRDAEQLTHSSSRISDFVSNSWQRLVPGRREPVMLLLPLKV